MRETWAAAPGWLRTLAVLGVPWVVGLGALGLALLVLPGPGLLVLLVASFGAAPWLAIVLGLPARDGSHPSRPSG